MKQADLEGARLSEGERPLVDWVVRRWSHSVYPAETITWEAGAEWTNLSGAAYHRSGRWIMVLDLGHILVLNDDFAEGVNESTDLVGDWSTPYVRPLNPRTIIAVNHICRFLAAQLADRASEDAAHPGWDTEYARGCATGYLLYWLINDS